MSASRSCRGLGWRLPQQHAVERGPGHRRQLDDHAVLLAEYSSEAGDGRRVASGPGGETTDQQGALRLIRQQSSGEVLLIVVAVGLAGYALWRLFRAALGHGPEGVDDPRDRLAALS